MHNVRYRTEAFSGTGERDAASVMAFETFELGNTDILEHLRTSILKDPELIKQCSQYIGELEESCHVATLSVDEGLDFFRRILDSIEGETGIRVNYVLWLADKDAVTARDWYGRDMEHDLDYDCYKVGPIVLSDLGYDGTLYGYTDLPLPLELDQSERGVPMDNETLNTMLYEKLFAEQEEYRAWLLTLPPHEILHHAYEYTTREDIVLAMEYHELSNGQAQALLESPSALDEIFHEFEQREGTYMDTIRDCIESRANDRLRAQPEIQLLSVEPCPDPDYGESIIQYKQGEDVVSFAFSAIPVHQIQSDPQKAIDALPAPAHAPLWSDLSPRLKDLIQASDHNMLFVEYEDEDWTTELANELWDEVCRHKLDGCVTCMEDDCYVTVYAGAIGAVNWSGAPTFGRPCLAHDLTTQNLTAQLHAAINRAQQRKEEPERDEGR